MIVTDHALVRWLTRVHEIDMEGFRRMLAEIAEPYAAAGVKYAEIGGFWFVFDGDKLVTVQERKPPFKQKRRNDKGNVNHTQYVELTPREQIKRIRARKGWK